MQVVSIQVAFGFLLVSLGLLAPLVLIASRTKRSRAFAIALIAGSNVVGWFVAALCLCGESSPSLTFSRFTPFPFALGLDRLSAFFLLLICTVAVPVAIFAASYFAHHYDGYRCNWAWIFFSLFLLSMIVVVTASTGFAFLVGWELMTLVSAGLILMEGDSSERRHNVFVYLLMMHAGAAAVMASFFLFLPYSHSLDFAGIRAAGAGIPLAVRTVIFLLAFVGFGTKAGIIPLHLWLPR